MSAHVLIVVKEITHTHMGCSFYAEIFLLHNICGTYVHYFMFFILFFPGGVLREARGTTVSVHGLAGPRGARPPRTPSPVHEEGQVHDPP